MQIASPVRHRQARTCLPGVCLLLAAMAGSGCTFYRSIGKGQHLAPTRPPPHHSVSKKGEEMQVAVTTDADGAVAKIELLKPSRSDAVNGYVSQSIQSSWPPVPSTRTIAKITHVPGGFSEPEIISTEPVR